MTLSLDPIDITDISTLTAPNVALLTTKSISGTGVFDVLMSVVKLHLLEEYNEGRITGEEYSTVYLGALNAVMQQSNAFIANHQNEERTRAEIGLIRQQTVSELARTDNTIPAGLGFNGTTAVEGLLANDLLVSAKQIDLITSQIATADAEEALIGQKIITELVETSSDLTTARAAGYGLNVTNSITGYGEAKLAQMAMELDLIEQKLTTEVAQTSSTKPIGLGQMDNTTTMVGVLGAQVIKSTAEIDLLNQKTATEFAQIADLTTGGAAVAGVVGKQKLLYAAQTDGFTRDAEQKAAKIMVDAWSVDATMGVGTANATNLLYDASLGTVITKLKAGIGI